MVKCPRSTDLSSNLLIENKVDLGSTEATSSIRGKVPSLAGHFGTQSRGVALCLEIKSRHHAVLYLDECGIILVAFYPEKEMAGNGGAVGIFRGISFHRLASIFRILVSSCRVFHAAGRHDGNIVRE